MLSEKVIEKLAERLVVRIQKQNEEILKQIGSDLKQFKTLSATKASQLAQILKYGGSYNNIIKKIQEITKLNLKDIEDIFEEVAKENYYFAKDFFKYRKIDFIPYEENEELKEVVNALAKITKNKFANFSNTDFIGFMRTNLDGKKEFVNIKKAYYELIDDAVLNVERGVTTFDQEMYKILKEYGQNGVNVVFDKSGKTMRLDSAIKMNMQEALTSLSNELQKQFGETYGADGIEISVHENPAPDHEDIQGRQFSLEQYENLQNGFDAVDYDGVIRSLNLNLNTSFRPIGTHNCYHIIFTIILGVNEPDYTEEQLQDIIKRNHDGFMYENVHYTNYEGTQIQRKLELQVRKMKDLQILAKASDNKELIDYAQNRITILTNKYKKFSKAANLPTYMERMRVTGYKRTKI